MDCSIEFYRPRVTFTAHPTSDESESSNFIPRRIGVNIKCEGIDWQVAHLAQVLSQISVVPTFAVHLSITSYSIAPDPEDMVDIEWLRLLGQFPFVRTFFVPKKIAGHVSRTLEDSAEVMATAEVFPVLDMLCLEGQPESSVNTFLTARRCSGRSVTFIKTETEFKERLRSYEKGIREVSY
ncbi:hypothetical protein EI94DRAFT_1755480 [Lactarius quietus]|nr:hypothetical protein EI94DRAFT_1755480 [Lactarius quietus]